MARTVGRPLAVYLAHTATVVIVAGALFTLQPRLLSGQFDGAYTYVRLANMFRWQPVDDPFGGFVPHEGMGGRISSQVFPLLPYLWPFWITDDPVTRVWAMYVILAGLLAASSLACYRAAGVSLGSALAASWLYLVVALTLPDLGRAVPNVLYAQFSLLAALTAFICIGQAGARRSAFCTAGFILVVFVSLLANLNFTAYVAGPVGALAIVAHLLACRTPTERWWKLGALILAGSAVIALGIPRWVSLLGASTSRLVFFAEIIAQPQYAHNAGMIYRPLDAFTIVYALAIVGVLGELLLLDGRRRVLGGLMAVLGVGVGVAGLIWLTTDYQWRGPAPAYVNVACFPWLALAAIRGIEHAQAWRWESSSLKAAAARWAGLAGALAAVCTGAFLVVKAAFGAASAWSVAVVALVAGGAWVLGHRPPPRRFARSVIYPLTIVLVLFSGDAVNLDVLRAGAWGQPNGAQHLVQSRPPFAELLQERVGIAPGRPFRGYADSYEERPRTLVLTPGELMEWQFRNIPTISQYSLYITAPYHAFITRLLNDPDDRPNVNHLTITRLDLRLLRLMGLRMLISNVPVDRPGLSLVATEGDRTLYELDDPNLGTYSPTRGHHLADTAAALAWMGRPDFDPRREFMSVGDDTVPADLVPASESELTLVPGGFRFRARSDGRSLVVLPIQFTRCLDLSDADGSGLPARAARVNLIQTGILFTGAVDVPGRVRYGGPWERCLERDFAEIDSLRLRELVQRRRMPAYSHPGSRLQLFAPFGLD